MTKADIVNEIYKTTGVDKAAVLTVIENFMEVVKDSLAHIDSAKNCRIFTVE